VVPVVGDSVVGESVLGDSDAVVTGLVGVVVVVVGDTVEGLPVVGAAVVGDTVDGDTVVGEAVMSEAVVGDAVVAEAVVGDHVVSAAPTPPPSSWAGTVGSAHVTPSPVLGGAHSHTNEPAVSVHVAVEAQLCVPSAHSSVPAQVTQAASATTAAPAGCRGRCTVTLNVPSGLAAKLPNNAAACAAAAASVWSTSRVVLPAACVTTTGTAAWRARHEPARGPGQHVAAAAAAVSPPPRDR
jgi:hypothetical protein